MNNIENNNLNDIEKEYFDIETPDNIDFYIKKGIDKGIKKRKKSRFKKIYTLAASLLLIVFFSLIRISPAFAGLVSEIPYMDIFVELINNDKSLQYAADNEYMQLIGNYDEYEGLKVTVENIIVDETRMFIFYSLKSNENYGCVNLHDIDIKDEKGENLEASISYSSFINKDLREEKELYSKIEVAYSEDMEIPDTVYFETTIRKNESGPDVVSDLIDYTWKIEIPIDKSKFENSKEEYLVNKTISIENQNITIDKVTIYPTRVSIKVAYDKDNTMKIFGLSNIRLIDQNGESFASIKNGISGSGLDDEYTFYLDSSYFTNPEELRLEFDGIRAIDKDKLTLEVDMKNEKIINNSYDNLELIDIKNLSDSININFKVIRNSDDETFYSIFAHKFKDSEGNDYNAISSGNSSSDDDNYYFGTLEIENNVNYKGNLFLTITGFPYVYKKDVCIVIK